MMQIRKHLNINVLDKMLNIFKDTFVVRTSNLYKIMGPIEAIFEMNYIIFVGNHFEWVQWGQ